MGGHDRSIVPFCDSSTSIDYAAAGRMRSEKALFR
jgi:hypothetical protein